jgi:hypothetical protein
VNLEHAGSSVPRPSKGLKPDGCTLFGCNGRRQGVCQLRLLTNSDIRATCHSAADQGILRKCYYVSIS